MRTRNRAGATHASDFDAASRTIARVDLKKTIRFGLRGISCMPPYYSDWKEQRTEREKNSEL